MLVMAMATSAAAEGAPRAPVLLVEPPATFDTARFATALETYVTNVRLEIAPHAAATDDVVCADAWAAAQSMAGPIGLWVRWTGDTIVVSMVTDAGCAAAQSTTVDAAPGDAAFVYRVAALKLASMVREVAPVAPPEVRAPPVVIAPVIVPAADPGLARTIDVGATGVASGAEESRLYGLVASAWIGARWSAGVTLILGAANEATGLAGDGRARMFGALGGARLVLVERGRFALDAEVSVGGFGVHASADRMTGGTTSETAWTPVASLAPRLRVAVAGPVSVTLGPTLDVSTRSVHLTLGETPLYQASLVRFRWDVRAQIWF